MPISVAHAPVGPTARNPQRRGERKREREREKGKGKGARSRGKAIQRKGRHFRLVEQPVTLFLRDNDELWL